MSQRYTIFLPIIIGFVGLLLSYTTIVQNTISLGWMSYFLPIVVDALLIYTSIQSYLFRIDGLTRISNIAKYITYSIMCGTLYLNNVHSFYNNKINYLSLVAHSFVVIAYIICVEFLLVQAKQIHSKKLKEEEINKNMIEVQERIEKEKSLLEYKNIFREKFCELEFFPLYKRLGF